MIDNTVLNKLHKIYLSIGKSYNKESRLKLITRLTRSVMYHRLPKARYQK